jgi:hypothetical protein
MFGIIQKMVKFIHLHDEQNNVLIGVMCSVSLHTGLLKYFPYLESKSLFILKNS